MPPFMKNGYVVASDDDAAAVLIDPGDEVGALLEAAARERLDIKAILLTHAHLDHITGVGEAKAALGVETWLHRDDDPLYRAVVQQGLMFGLRVPAQPPVDRFYEDHQRITVGGLQIAVHPTPGHSPGHVSYLVHARGGPVLITGDAAAYHAQLVHRIRPAPGVFDPGAAARSLDQLARMAEQFPRLRVAVGHEAQWR